MNKRIEEEVRSRKKRIDTNEFLKKIEEEARNPRVVFGPNRFFCSKWVKVKLCLFNLPKLEAPKL